MPTRPAAFRCRQVQVRSAVAPSAQPFRWHGPRGAIPRWRQRIRVRNEPINRMGLSLGILAGKPPNLQRSNKNGKTPVEYMVNKPLRPPAYRLAMSRR